MVFEDETFSSADFSTICSLAYLGFEPVGFERDYKSPGKAIAYFKRSHDLDNALQLLHSRELKFEPVGFLEMTRAVRGRLRDCA